MGGLGDGGAEGAVVDRGGGLGEAAGTLGLQHGVHGLSPWRLRDGAQPGAQLLGSAPMAFALCFQAWNASSGTAVLGERERTTSPLTSSSVGDLPWRARKAAMACSTSAERALKAWRTLVGTPETSKYLQWRSVGSPCSWKRAESSAR
ncbi:MAG: hypothetical protein M0027_08920 [Candidatus Dormibacteraeota bacterium]|nr:hypothetical protein [Candidatus Dormibacteraeota bacterium]